MSDELRKLDEQCAQALGWHKGAGGAIIGGYGYQSPVYWYDAYGKQCAPCATDAFMNMYAFSPTTDHAAARLLEDEIERRDLKCQYIGWLIGYTSLCSNEIDQHWALIRATPERKVKAFLDTIRIANAHT